MWLLCLFVFAGEPVGEPDPMELFDQFIDGWHRAAAQADAEEYFGQIAEKGVFIGTDATERWTKKEFQEWAAPHFKKESAWTLVPEKRFVQFSADASVIWFDEELSTSMGPCRGTGVVINTPKGWKIAHYCLSFSIPNEIVDDLKPMVAKALANPEKKSD